MSFVPAIAEVLAERFGCPTAEVESLIREGLAESHRRRWRTLTAEERAQLQGEIERARSVEEQPFPPDTVTRIPLSLLPFFLRRIREDLATARAVWQEAHARHQDTYTARTIWYYEHENLQITVAQKKASLDPRVQDIELQAGEYKRRVEALERAEQNLMQELEVRLVLTRSGVLSDPEAVHPL